MTAAAFASFPALNFLSRAIVFVLSHNVFRDAAMMSMRRAIAGKRPEEIRNMSKTDVLHPISQEDFESALAKISRSVGKTDIEKYEKWREEFGAQ
jgi:katanin p60 ATPase-containing subunit A1